VVAAHAKPHLVKSANTDQPLFLYVHVFQPHAPYDPPESARTGLVDPDYTGPADGSRRSLDDHRHHVIDAYAPKDLKALSDLYDANLRYADTAIAATLAALEENGLADDTLVLVVGDHGEAFGQHGSLEHSETTYGEEVEVPFVLAVPGLDAGRVSGAVSLTDVLPTVLSLLGVATPDESAAPDGINLSSRLVGAPAVERPLVLRSAGALPRFAIRSHGFAYHADLRTRWEALFDLRNDPAEEIDVIAEHPVLAEYLRTELGMLLLDCSRSQHATADIDPETLQQIEQIGYATSGQQQSELLPLMRRLPVGP